MSIDVRCGFFQFRCMKWCDDAEGFACSFAYKCFQVYLLYWQASCHRPNVSCCVVRPAYFAVPLKDYMARIDPSLRTWKRSVRVSEDLRLVRTLVIEPREIQRQPGNQTSFRRLLHLEVHQGELRAFQADGQQMDLSLTKFPYCRLTSCAMLYIVELGLIVQDLQVAMEKGVSERKVYMSK